MKITVKTINGRTSLVFFIFLVLIIGFSIYTIVENSNIENINTKLKNSEFNRADYFIINNNFANTQAGMLEVGYKYDSVKANYFPKSISQMQYMLSVIEKRYDTLGISGYKTNSDSVNFALEGIKIVYADLAQSLDVIHKNKELSPTQKKLIIDTLYQKKIFGDPFQKYIGLFYTHIWAQFAGVNDKYRPDYQEALGDKNQNIILFALLITVASVILVSAGWLYFSKELNLSIQKPREVLNKLAEGQLVESIIINKDELASITEAANKVVFNLKQASDFALEIGKGNFENQFIPLSNDDILGNSLLQMRDELKSFKEAEQIRNWSNEGYAHFALITRNSKGTIEETCYPILHGLVKYIKANQGVMSLLQGEEENDPHLNITACYAYQKRKFLKKRIEIGEGLSGQCFLEKEIIYLTEIPETFVSITSGLGEALPKTLLIVPVKYEEKVVGVVELASFHLFKQYEIEFIQRVCEDVASVLNNVKINIKMQATLSISQEQAEGLREQEEEMRQNLEEFQSTQEQMVRSQITMDKERQELFETIAELRESEKLLKEELANKKS